MNLNTMSLLSLLILTTACSAIDTGKEYCYKNKMYYPNDSKLCGDIKPLVTVRDGGVNLG